MSSIFYSFNTWEQIPSRYRLGPTWVQFFENLGLRLSLDPECEFVSQFQDHLLDLDLGLTLS